MNKTFLLKFIAVMWTWIRLTAILFPLCFLLVSAKQGTLQYGYDFFEVDYRWALMISIGIAMTLVAWTAMEFGKLQFNDVTQYLKSRQLHYYYFKSADPQAGEIGDKLTEYVKGRRSYRLTEVESGWVLQIRNRWLLSDLMKISRQGPALRIESSPKGLSWMVDAGRNFRHILELGEFLKRESL